MAWHRPSLDDALSRFGELSAQLAELHVETGEIEYAELGARKAAWHGSREGSVSGRGRDAEFGSIDWSMELVRKRAEIKAIETELRYLDKEIGIHSPITGK